MGFWRRLSEATRGRPVRAANGARRTFSKVISPCTLYSECNLPSPCWALPCLSLAGSHVSEETWQGSLDQYPYPIAHDPGAKERSLWDRVPEWMRKEEPERQLTGSVSKPPFETVEKGLFKGLKRMGDKTPFNQGDSNANPV